MRSAHTPPPFCQSFDYRCLNALLYALRGAAPDAPLLEFLRADELLVDIGERALW